MAFSDDLFFAPAHKLAAMLRAREVSSVEMVDAFIERIETVNRGLNAVVTLVEERAAREAEESDQATVGQGRDSAARRAAGDDQGFDNHRGRALDLGHEDVRASRRQAGRADGRAAARGGCDRYREDQYARDDDGLRLRQSGVRARPTIRGIASACPADRVAARRRRWRSECRRSGWDRIYRGSIRVPAHFCGIVGLKPTWGTIPGSGHMAPSIASPPPIAHMATIGPMARYVDDLTLAYNVVKGPHPSSPYTVPTARGAS